MTATINVKTDSELKKQAEALFSDLGMNMTTALNVFLRQAVRENRIPFEITRDPYSLEKQFLTHAQEQTFTDHSQPPKKPSLLCWRIRIV